MHLAPLLIAIKRHQFNRDDTNISLVTRAYSSSSYGVSHLCFDMVSDILRPLAKYR
jgi:hypothetical protein